MSPKIATWNDQLPDPSTWRPRVPGSSENLRSALQMTCRGAQRRIITEAELERSFNIDSFDSGAGLEDVVRQELRRLLPTRYDISPGVVNDAGGRTVGDCDVVISNRMWAPLVKLGATGESRRVHVPVESVYAVVEVKQTGTFEAVDAAMQKLVAVARLDRPPNPYGHITENQHLQMFDRAGQLLNPLFTILLATRPDPHTPFDELARRFFAVNRSVASGVRDDMVKILCVLDGGTAYYSAGPDRVTADFCRDRNQDLEETAIGSSPGDAFYIMLIHLLGHLTRSVLNIVDVSHGYGSQTWPAVFGGKLPPSGT